MYVMRFVHFFLHYFTPHHTNNQKAKVLHLSTILYLLAFIFFIQAVISFLPLTGARVLGYASQISVFDIISISNQKRTSQGIPELKHSQLLSEAARKKGEHMLANDYWAHVAPDGTQPWYFFSLVGYNYRYAGENLARDFASANSAVEAWMASPSHRENLLSPKYTEIGVAVVEGDLNGVDTTIIVQLFGTQASSSQLPLAQANSDSRKSLASQSGSIAGSLNENSMPVSTSLDLEEVSPFDSNDSNLPALVNQDADFKISPFDTTKNVSLAIVGLLFVATIVDGFVIAVRKTPRVGGKSFAHFAFLTMIILIIVVAKAGEIL